MRRSWLPLALPLSALICALGCDETPAKADLKDVCPEYVAKVKAQCGEDSPAYKRHKELYVDAAPQGEAKSEAEAQMRVRRIVSCHKGLAVANEKLDYSEEPNFSVGNDVELQEQAKAAKQHWEQRKAAYQKMSPEERKKDEDAQLLQRCMLWKLG